MSTNENLFENIPQNIRRFRYENSLIFYRKDNDSVDLYFKNIEEHSHIHFFDKNKKSGMVLTREDRRGKKNEHITINPETFLKSLGNACFSTWSLIEWIDPQDPNLKGKIVTLCSIPRLVLDKIQGRKAYFKNEMNVEEMVFEDIDPYEMRFGTIQNKKGLETDALLVRNGEIYRLNVKEIKKLEKNFNNDPFS